MSDNTRKRPPPFSLRLSPEERARLIAEAADVPLGRFIRERLLHQVRFNDAPVGRSLAEPQALARVLAELGRSRLSSNLNQIAKAIHLGIFPAGPETEAEIRAACVAIKAMRDDLLLALGRSGGGRR